MKLRLSLPILLVTAAVLATGCGENLDVATAPAEPADIATEKTEPPRPESAERGTSDEQIRGFQRAANELPIWAEFDFVDDVSERGKVIDGSLVGFGDLEIKVVAEREVVCESADGEPIEDSKCLATTRIAMGSVNFKTSEGEILSIPLPVSTISENADGTIDTSAAERVYDALVKAAPADAAISIRLDDGQLVGPNALEFVVGPQRHTVTFGAKPAESG